jgi:hypothetical protein
VDVESAYHHVEISPRHRTLVGFRFEGVMYVYNVLPFDLTTSASVLCLFTAVTVKAVRASGLVSRCARFFFALRVVLLKRNAHYFFLGALRAVLLELHVY